MKTCSKCKLSKKLEEFVKDIRYKDNRQAICKACKSLLSSEYYKKNKDSRKAYAKIYAKSNKKKISKQKSEYQKNKAFSDPLYKLSCNIRNLIKNSFKKQGFSKSSKTSKILGCSFEELQTHLRATFEMNYGLPFSWIDTSLLHIDHIIPLATAKTKEELLKLNHFSNLQYLLAEDNLEKGDSLDWNLR